LNLSSEKPASKFAFKCNLHRYKKGVTLNTCKESKKEGIVVKCSCGSSSSSSGVKAKGGGGSLFSFVTQVRSSPFGRSDDDDGGDDKGDGGGSDKGSSSGGDDDDKGSEEEEEEEEAMATMGRHRQPGPAWVVRNPWFHGGSLIDWFNEPRPAFHLWSLGARPAASAATSAATSTGSASTSQEKKKSHQSSVVVLTNGGVVSAAAAVAVVAATVGLNTLNPVETHSLKAPGFNPRTYKVKNRFQAFAFKCNL
jgi:hypothetical protein